MSRPLAYKRLLAFLLTSFFAATCVAQTYLYVTHKKKLRYEVGDAITVLVDGRKISGEIARFTDSSFFLQSRREIPLREIDIIYRKNPRRGAIRNIYIAAFALPIIDVANNGAPVDDGIWNITAVLAGTALTLQLLHKKKVRIANESQLQVIGNP